MTPSSNEIVTLAATAMFGKPLVTNVHRAILVEAIVSRALATGWTWCSADYASWDFEHEDGTRLEVKQSAAKQSWDSIKPSVIGWDIAARRGTWDGQVWQAGVRRNAHIYVLGVNPIADASADHRDPRQWRFFVINEKLLPATKRLTLARASTLAEEVAFDRLAAKVEDVRCGRMLPAVEMKSDCAATDPAAR